MPERAVSGGLYRTQRLVETMRAFELIVVDSDTTDIQAQKVFGRLFRYPARRLYAFQRWLFPAFRVLNWLWSCLALVVIGLTRERFDAVYAPNSELPQVSFAAWLVGRVRRVPVVFGNLNVRGNQLWGFNRVLHRHADAIITLSHGLANEIRAEGIDVPIYVGSVGVDDLSTGQQCAPAYDVIYVARHTVEKGALDMVDIVRLCSAQLPSMRVAMVGPCTDAMRRRLEATVADAGLERHIDFFGAVTESEKWQLLERSRLCAFPSHVEGWGIVPIEAHLCGLPVVAYDLPAYEETIRHSPAATLVPDGDIQAFARATLAMLQSPFVSGSAVREWARQFTWARAARIEEELLTRILQDTAAYHRRVPSEG